MIVPPSLPEAGPHPLLFHLLLWFQLLLLSHLLLWYGTQNHYFHTRQEAIRYLEELTGQASLRETTLEDVFVERAGKHLISK